MVLCDQKGGERKGVGPRRSGEAEARAGERQRAVPGRVSQAASLPKERSRTGRSPGTRKLGVNLSCETSRRAGKCSGARLTGRHQKSRLSCCQPEPCSASRASSEVHDCSGDCGLKGRKNQKQSLGGSTAVSGVVHRVLALPSPARQCLDGFGQGRGAGLQTAALKLEVAA